MPLRILGNVVFPPSVHLIVRRSRGLSRSGAAFVASIRGSEWKCYYETVFKVVCKLPEIRTPFVGHRPISGRWSNSISHVILKGQDLTLTKDSRAP